MKERSEKVEGKWRGEVGEKRENGRKEEKWE